MQRGKKFSVFLILVSICCASTLLLADVKKESKTEFKFKGGLGTVMKFLGVGKPVRSAEYVKGNLFRRDELDKKGKVRKSHIIDLDQELIIDIDHKKKRYTKMTFAEWRAMMEENLKKVQEATGQADSESGDKQENKPETEVEWKFDFEVSTPGETAEIAGQTAEKVIVKLKIEAEATQQDSATGEIETARGGLAVNSTNWMCKDLEGEKEFAEFHRKFIEKLGMMPGQNTIKAITDKLMANNPQLAAAIKKVQDEREHLEGTALRIHTVYETWGEQPKQEEQVEKIPTSVGGLFKKFGKKKKKEDSNVLLETKIEITKYSESPLDVKMFTVPAKYKEKKKK